MLKCAFTAESTSSQDLPNLKGSEAKTINDDEFTVIKVKKMRDESLASLKVMFEMYEFSDFMIEHNTKMIYDWAEKNGIENFQQRYPLELNKLNVKAQYPNFFYTLTPELKDGAFTPENFEKVHYNIVKKLDSLSKT
jgi:hypothetical protein